MSNAEQLLLDAQKAARKAEAAWAYAVWAGDETAEAKELAWAKADEAARTAMKLASNE